MGIFESRDIFVLGPKSDFVTCFGDEKNGKNDKRGRNRGINKAAHADRPDISTDSERTHVV